MSDDPEAPPVLRGDRTVLRAWRPDDEDALVAACRDPEVQRWTRVPSPYGRRDARDFLAHRAPGAADAGGAAFCVEERARPGELAGSMALLHLVDGVGEIGYWTAAHARGRGVARDALAVLCRWAFARRGAARLELWVEPGNAASLAVAGAVGFVREGLLRRRHLIGGEHRDVVVLGLLPPQDPSLTGDPDLSR